MSDLSAFFAQDQCKVDNVKYVASKRFVDKKTHKPIEWELRELDADEDISIKKSCQRKVKVGGQYTLEFDNHAYIAKSVVASVVFPNLNAKELQDSYHVMGAEALLRKMLKPAEYDALANKVYEINGYGDNFNEVVDEAKN